MIRSLLLSSAMLAAACPGVAQSGGVSDGQPSATAGLVPAAKPSIATTTRTARPKPPSAAMLRVRAANRAAIQEPQMHGFLSAMQVYPYREGVLYRLYAAPERVTDVALQSGEGLVSVAAGDTVRWTVGDTTSGTGEGKRVHILIKPFAAGLRTNLIITTDRRVYHLQMESTAATAMAGLSWSYPQDALIALRRAAEQEKAATPVASGLAVEQLNFAYAISGDAPAWRPLRAFDDGRQTFIEFPASIAVGEAPPLFVIGEDGEAALVNYRMSGRFYVVDRLFGAAELRLGGKHQQIVRIARVDEQGPRRRRGS